MVIAVLAVCAGLVPAVSGRSGHALGQSAGTPPRAAGAVAGSDDEDVPMEVQGDTADYCAQLERIIGKQPNRPDEVRQLVKEGHQMCDHGQVRIGILYMRRALMILRRRPLILGQP